MTGAGHPFGHTRPGAPTRAQASGQAGRRESAPAKVNLILHVGPRLESGLHELCSLFASIDLADDVMIEPRADAAGTAADALGDVVDAPGVPGRNLADEALAAFRAAAPAAPLPPLAVEIAKRIPVAAGLGGGSADAAAVLRAANRIAGEPLDAAALLSVAAAIGSDVPSQLDPGHALVTATGERVEPVELPPFALVLVPQEEGLSTAAVYAELDRLGGAREFLDPAPLRAVAAASVEQLASALENDLQRAALSLRPELGGVLAALREAGALGALVSGSGPTAFGIFAGRPEAEAATSGLPRAVVAQARAA